MITPLIDLEAAARLARTAFEELADATLEFVPRAQQPDELLHEDWCRLSRLFNETADLRHAQDGRINEWLKRKIAKSASVIHRPL
jgi:hypothetical protein